jgi:hypothetical protein
MTREQIIEALEGGEAGREIGAIWCEAWINGEAVEIDCETEAEALEWGYRSQRSNASGWVVCVQTFIGRKPLQGWARGPSYREVCIRQALEDQISHRAAGIPQAAFVQPALLAALLRAGGE